MQLQDRENTAFDEWPRIKTTMVFCDLTREEALRKGEVLGIVLDECVVISVKDKPYLWTVESLAAIIPPDTRILGFDGLESILPPNDRTSQAVKRFAYQVEDRLAIPGLAVMITSIVSESSEWTCDV